MSKKANKKHIEKTEVSKRKRKWIPSIKDNLDLVKKSFVEFVEQDSFMHGAALAYYAVIALVPMIYLAFTYIGMFVGQDRIIEIVSDLIQNNMGISNVTPITELLYKSNIGKSPNQLTQVVGIIALIFTSTAMFNSLSKSLNTFFGIRNRRYRFNSRFLDKLFKRLISFGFMAFLGFLIVFVYFGQSVLIGFGARYLSDGSVFQEWLFFVLEHFSILVLNFIAFTFVFKFLHDGVVQWKLAMTGAFFTSLLLYIGQLLINFYLSNFFFAANSGIAGTVLAILAWIFYTSQIIFFGAKIMSIYAEMVRMPIMPKRRKG